MARYLGGGLPSASAGSTPLGIEGQGTDVVEVVWRPLGEQSYLTAYARDGRRRSLGSGKGNGSGVAGPAHDSILAAARRLAEGAPVLAVTRLNDYDSYYYPNHRRGPAEKPLPVLRVELGDAAAPHLYIDPLDGRLLARLDQSRRVYRWLWSGLHHWDLGWLYTRPVWDLWMLTWVLLGLVLSVTSVVIGFKRLRRSVRVGKPSAPTRQPVPRLATETQGR